MAIPFKFLDPLPFFCASATALSTAPPTAFASLCFTSLWSALSIGAAAYNAPACTPGRATAACSRSSAPVMDETIIQKALAGELEEEGAENVFLSEVGWAYYLDKEGQQSYNMNERFSLASDGYVTPSILSNPLDVLIAYKDAILKAASDPLQAAFPTISNDKSGARAWAPGGEVKARTIKPKAKDFDPKKRITGIPGYNMFGAPGSKGLFGGDPEEELGGIFSK